MKDFILKLYAMDHFTLYMTIALIVLIVLFIIIFIFGKKDQKLEETRKLQKITLEHNGEIKKLPLPKNIETKNEEIFKKEVLTPKEEPKTQEVLNYEIPKVETKLIEDFPNMEVTEFDPQVIANEKTKEINNDILLDEIAKSQKNLDAISIEKQDNLAKLNANLENELTELENIKKEFNEIKIPKVEEKPFQSSPVFSSVFVDEKAQKENVEEPLIVVSSPNETKPTPTLFPQEEDELDLPTLKVSNNQNNLADDIIETLGKSR